MTGRRACASLSFEQQANYLGKNPCWISREESERSQQKTRSRVPSGLTTLEFSKELISGNLNLVRQIEKVFRILNS
ncbi:hypothetical protein NDI44_25930 [Trichocoleus sp. DQ-A3]|uniref:hypothetical protein n=1 Tax=Cyanophyceae TaxID=3028117 RepID=UPI0016848D9E|nr:hypothetical protein [Coleofasciculus sp. FACHB-125]MBD1903469.1 hypothetical protein [Coleofasciculus sp. FACHB-125]